MKEYEDSVRESLLKLHMQGLTTRQIAAKLGVSASGVSRNLVRFRRSGKLVEEPPPNKHSRRRSSIGLAAPERSSGATSRASSVDDDSGDDGRAATDAATPEPVRVASTELAPANAAETGASVSSAEVAAAADATEAVAATTATSFVKHNPPRSARVKSAPTGDRNGAAQPEKVDGSTAPSRSNTDDATATRSTSAENAVVEGLPSQHPPQQQTVTRGRKRLRSDDEARAVKQPSNKRAASGRSAGRATSVANTSASISDSRNAAESVSDGDSRTIASPSHSAERARTSVECSTARSTDRTAIGQGSQTGRGAVGDANLSNNAAPAEQSVTHQVKKKWRKGELCWAGWLANSIASPAHPSNSESTTSGAIQLVYRCRFRGRYHPGQIIGLSDRQASGTGILEERDNTLRGQSTGDSDSLPASA